MYSSWIHKTQRNIVEVVAFDAVNVFYRRKIGLVNGRISMTPLKQFKQQYEAVEEAAEVLHDGCGA